VRHRKPLLFSTLGSILHLLLSVVPARSHVDDAAQLLHTIEQLVALLDRVLV
jgi:hypothetical protein